MANSQEPQIRAGKERQADCNRGWVFDSPSKIGKYARWTSNKNHPMIRRQFVVNLGTQADRD